MAAVHDLTFDDIQGCLTYLAHLRSVRSSIGSARTERKRLLGEYVRDMATTMTPAFFHILTDSFDEHTACDHLIEELLDTPLRDPRVTSSIGFSDASDKAQSTNTEVPNFDRDPHHDFHAPQSNLSDAAPSPVDNLSTNTHSSAVTASDAIRSSRRRPRWRAPGSRKPGVVCHECGNISPCPAKVWRDAIRTYLPR